MMMTFNPKNGRMFFVTFSYSYLLQGDYIYILTHIYIYIL